MPCDTVANWHRPRIHQLHERSQFSSPRQLPVRPLAASDRQSAPLMIIINLRFADRHIPVFMPPNYPFHGLTRAMLLERSAGPSSRIHRVDRVDYHFFMKLAAVRSGLAQYAATTSVMLRGWAAFFIPRLPDRSRLRRIIERSEQSPVLQPLFDLHRCLARRARSARIDLSSMYHGASAVQ